MAYHNLYIHQDLEDRYSQEESGGKLLNHLLRKHYEFIDKTTSESDILKENLRKHEQRQRVSNDRN